MIEQISDLNLIETISAVMILLGSVIFLGATIGVIRFPDFYTRMHAAGKGDTLSSILVLTGLALYNLNDFTWIGALVSLKILGIAFLILCTSPTSTHALMQSGYEAGISPWKHDEDSATNDNSEKS